MSKSGPAFSFGRVGSGKSVLARQIVRFGGQVARSVYPPLSLITQLQTAIVGLSVLLGGSRYV